MSKSTGIIAKGHQQKGFSLIEMMVSMTLGMIAIAGVISIFVSSVKSNGEGLSQIQLNQELRAIMDVMVRDIRRSGYWAAADGVTANPFQTLATNAGNNCIIYSYDAAEAGAAAPVNTDRFGFRLNGGAVEIRQNGAACGDAGNWVDISNSAAVTITNLAFAVTQSCTNVSSNVRDCAAAQTGDVLSTMFIVDITLQGQLVNDNNVNLTLTETVTVRNTQSTVAA